VTAWDLYYERGPGLCRGQFGHPEEDSQRWNAMMVGVLWQFVFENTNL
jgi:hypothetical protein